MFYSRFGFFQLLFVEHLIFSLSLAIYKTILPHIKLSVYLRLHVRLFRDIGLQSLKEFRQARRIALTEDFDDLADFVKRIKPDAQLDLDSYEQKLEKERDSATLYPEARKVLEALNQRNLKLGSISNLASQYKKPFFELGLHDYLDEFLFSCEVGLIKPDPMIYHKMIAELGIDPSQALMIGDNAHTDVDGPKSIGMNAVHLDRTNTSLSSISTLEGVFQYL